MRSFGSYRKDWLFTGTIWIMAGLVGIMFFWLVGRVFWSGWGQISFDFLRLPSEDAGRSGGIAPMIASTTLILGICMATAIPIGLGASIFLSEYVSIHSYWGRCIRKSLDVLAGIPSIVFGLFGSAFFCKIMGLGFSILAGGLTLACMVLPIFIRTAEEGFRAVPSVYREGAEALGFRKTSVLFKVLVPLALPGIVSGFVLGVGRALAETAALIFTSGYVDRYPESLMDSGRSLSIHIYDLSMNVAGGDKNAYGSALVLLAMVFLINHLATWISESYRKRRYA